MPLIKGNAGLKSPLGSSQVPKLVGKMLSEMQLVLFNWFQQPLTGFHGLATLYIVFGFLLLGSSSHIIHLSCRSVTHLLPVLLDSCETPNSVLKAPSLFYLGDVCLAAQFVWEAQPRSAFQSLSPHLLPGPPLSPFTLSNVVTFTQFSSNCYLSWFVSRFILKVDTFQFCVSWYINIIYSINYTDNTYYERMHTIQVLL